MSKETETTAEAPSFSTVIFPGDASDAPIRGCINGESYEYPRAVPVEARSDHLEVIGLFTPTDIPVSSPEPLPDGEGAASAPTGGSDAGEAPGGAVSGVSFDTALLAESTAKIAAGIADLSVEHIQALHDAEAAKDAPRKSVMTVLDAAIAAAS